MDRVGSMVQSLTGGAIVIEGDAGMGKSRLLQEVQEAVLNQFTHRICVVFGCSDMSHKSQVPKRTQIWQGSDGFLWIWVKCSIQALQRTLCLGLLNDSPGTAFSPEYRRNLILKESIDDRFDKVMFLLHLLSRILQLPGPLWMKGRARNKQVVLHVAMVLTPTC